MDGSTTWRTTVEGRTLMSIYQRAEAAINEFFGPTQVSDYALDISPGLDLTEAGGPTRFIYSAEVTVYLPGGVDA